jgi:hypothetical protein
MCHHISNAFYTAVWDILQDLYFLTRAAIITFSVAKVMPSMLEFRDQLVITIISVFKKTKVVRITHNFEEAHAAFHEGL